MQLPIIRAGIACFQLVRRKNRNWIARKREICFHHYCQWRIWLPRWIPSDNIRWADTTAWLLLADFDFAFINPLISRIQHLIACSAAVPRVLCLVTLSAELLDHSPG